MSIALLLNNPLPDANKTTTFLHSVLRLDFVRYPNKHRCLKYYDPEMLCINATNPGSAGGNKRRTGRLNAIGTRTESAKHHCVIYLHENLHADEKANTTE